MTSSSATPITLAITGMSCGHCVRAVDAALAALPGVAVHEVAVGRATVALDAAHGPSVDAVLAAVDDAGYPARVAAPGELPASDAGPLLGLRRRPVPEGRA